MLGLLHLNDRSHAGGAVSLLPQALRIASSDYTQTKDEDQNPQNIGLTFHFVFASPYQAKCLRRVGVIYRSRTR